MTGHLPGLRTNAHQTYAVEARFSRGFVAGTPESDDACVLAEDGTAVGGRSGQERPCGETVGVPPMARIRRVAFHDEWLPIDFVELSDRPLNCLPCLGCQDFLPGAIAGKGR